MQNISDLFLRKTTAVKFSQPLETDLRFTTAGATELHAAGPGTVKTFACTLSDPLSVRPFVLRLLDHLLLNFFQLAEHLLKLFMHRASPRIARAAFLRQDFLNRRQLVFSL